jgi:hypothetical protein
MKEGNISEELKKYNCQYKKLYNNDKKVKQQQANRIIREQNKNNVGYH